MRRVSSRVVPYLAGAVLAVVLATAMPAVQAQAPPSEVAGFDLAAAENGGRVEWASKEFRGDAQGVAMNLTAATRHPGWIGSQRAEDEIVFSFFDGEPALVAGVLVNPVTREWNDRPKDVEIWTSVTSATGAEAFTKVASAMLENVDALQPVTFAPVEARFVKLRILSTNPALPTSKPGDFATGASRVAILEGEGPGYVNMLARHPELAELARGVLPAAPPEAAGGVPDTAGPAGCSLPAAETQPAPRFTQSRQVLVVTDDPNGYRAVAWRTSAADDSSQEGRLVVPDLNYTWLTTAVASPAHLLSYNVDTVVFAQVCRINEHLTPAFKQALLAWVAAGHKMIIQDSDYCAGPNTPNYPFMPYPFATANPGAAGAAGEAGVLENSTLVSADGASPAFIDTAGWAAGPNDLGDSNVVVEYDARWCGAMWARNKLQKNGLTLAYSHYGRGLIIYDGLDYDQFANPIYRKLVGQELLQPFDPDGLPCSQPLGNFMLATNPGQRSQPMAAGRTYTYPVRVLGNYGYSGSIELEADVTPADPAIAVTLSGQTADLTTVDEATLSLTVSAGADASLRSKVVSVRGRDAAGKSNVLCLALSERETGSVSVANLLLRDKPPTKNIVIILDASGSMKAMLGAKSRWGIAQDVLKEVVAKLPADSSVGLRAYGHTLSSKDPNTCTDTSLIVPVEPLNPERLLAAAQQLAPRGETPLVYSILQTQKDLQALGGGTVILITDGEESCKGDFATAAAELQASSLDLLLNVVGFTLDNAPAEAQLSGLAESTGGHYYGAANGEALSHALLLAAVDRLPYRILDAAGAEVAQGEAGITSAHELAPGDYTVVISAAGEELRTPVSIEVGQDIMLKLLIKNGELKVETSGPGIALLDGAADEVTVVRFETDEMVADFD